MSTAEEVLADVDDDKSTTIRTRVTMADGRSHDIREKYTTAKRYIEKAKQTEDLAAFSKSPTNRVALNPAAIVDIEELER